MKLVLAATGASGALYLQRLLDQIDPSQHEVHLLFSNYSRQVIHEELGELRVPEGVLQHGDKSMNVPFVSGSALFDAMVIIPCSMGTVGRIAAGTSESVILRAADVFLKEKRKLILVPRETPFSVGDAGTAISAAAAGLGKARVPAMLAEGAIASGRVAALGPPEPGRRAYWLVAPLPQWRQKKVKALVAALIEAPA